MITTTYLTSDPSVARHQCDECGKWERADKAGKGLLLGEIAHSRSCESKCQAPEVAAQLAARAESERVAGLRRFAANVRKHGVTKGRDADVAECVRLGLLSAGEAQNSDD